MGRPAIQPWKWAPGLEAELWKEAIADQHANVTRMISHHTSLHITLLKIHIPGRGMQWAQLGPVAGPWLG